MSGYRARAARGLVAIACALAGPACVGEPPPQPPPGAAADTAGGSASAEGDLRTWTFDTLPGTTRLRPTGMSDSVTAWGIERGRLARLRLDGSPVERLEPVAWDVTTAPGLAAWRNEHGVWLLREGGRSMRVADANRIGEFEGPPEILLSPDGGRAVLSWRAEWSFHHELLAADGSRRPLDVALSGHMAHAARLWLDSTRILFSAVAIGPVRGPAEYRESGWRADLAVLDLDAGHFQRVTAVPDGRFLRPAGRYRGRVLVAERDEADVLGYWLYHPLTWERQPLELPAGRAFAAENMIIVFAPDSLMTGAPDRRSGQVDGDALVAVLVQGDSILPLGPVADPDLSPAFAPDGRTALLRIAAPGGARLLRISTR